MLRNKYHNIYLFTPISSFKSVKNHPFKDHDKVFNELTIEILEQINEELMNLKSELEDEDDVIYSCIIIDDYANELKNKNMQIILNKMLIKSRHISCTFIFTLQSFYYMPKILRKQISYAIIFKTSKVEWESIAYELINMDKYSALQLYNYAYKEPFNHLDLEISDNNIYLNFNKLVIKDDEDNL